MRCLRHPVGTAALAAAIAAAALSDVVAAAPLVVPLTAADFQTQAGGMTATDSSDEVRGPVIKAPTTYTGDYAYIRSAPLAAGTLDPTTYGGISLWVRADSPQQLDVMFDSNTADAGQYLGFTRRITAGPQWQRLYLPFRTFVSRTGKAFGDGMPTAHAWWLTLGTLKKDAPSGGNTLYFSDVALEAKASRPAAGDRDVTASRSTPPPPGRPWEMKAINGRTFWNVMEPGYLVHDDPIYRDSALRIEALPNLYDKDFVVIDALTQRKLESPTHFPLSIWHLRYDTDYAFWKNLEGQTGPSPQGLAAFRRFEERHGDGFLGFCLPEFEIDVRNATNISQWDRWDYRSDTVHPYLAWKRDPEKRSLVEKRIPSNADFASKDEVRKLLLDEFKWMQGLLYGKVFVMTQSLTDHLFLENGGTAACTEFTGSGMQSHQLQAMFTRGAARQYGKPWGTYIALFLAGLHPATLVDPGVEIPDKAYPSGRDYGVSPSMHRRDLFFSYAAGATFVDHESQHTAFWERPVKGTNRRSAHGQALDEWSVFVSRNPDRGVAYTPVGLLFDYDHGITEPEYGKTWWRFPFDDGDLMSDHLLNLLVPWKRGGSGGEERNLVSTPYGDIFDALVANPPSGVISGDVLDHYSVLILMGNIRMTTELADRLVAYVRGGGTLVINAAQHLDMFPAEFTGGTPAAAAVLAQDAAGNPLARRVRFGQGTVYATLPPFLLDGGKKLLPFVSDVLGEALADVLPFTVTGDVQYLVNRRTDGWWITLINNKGVVKPPKQPARVDPAKAVDVRIDYPGGAAAEIRELVNASRLRVRRGDSARVECTVPPGEVRVIQIVERTGADAEALGPSLLTGLTVPDFYGPGGQPPTAFDSGDAARGGVITWSTEFPHDYVYIRSIPLPAGVLDPAKSRGISFWAKADAPQTLDVTLDHQEDGTYVGFSTSVAVGTEWKKFDLPFTDFKNRAAVPISGDMLTSHDWRLTLMALKKTAPANGNSFSFDDIVLWK